MAKRCRCKVCGQQFWYRPTGAGRPPAYCSADCREDRQREWSAAAMAALRERRRRVAAAP